MAANQKTFLCFKVEEPNCDASGVLTQEVSREVDGQDDADGEDADDDQQADDVPLEGQVVNSILATLLPDLLIPAGGEAQF